MSSIHLFLGLPVILVPMGLHSSILLDLFIHVSVRRISILIRSNKMQQYEGIYLLQNHSLHVSGVHRTHHQENIKL